MSTYSGRFAKRLRKLREKADYTVSEVVGRMEKFGVTITDKTYYHWEASRSDPKFDSLPALAKSLKIKNIQELLPKK